MEQAKIRLSGVAQESVVDGPGIRFTVFVQGCPHKCAGCHNPQTHPFDGGYEVAPDDLFGQIISNPLITGVTLSGGEPMCQASALLPLALRLREHGMSLAVYTGYTLEELLEENDSAKMTLLAACDVLIDGRFVETKRTLELPFRGSENQRILDAQKSLQKRRAVETSSASWRR